MEYFKKAVGTILPYPDSKQIFARYYNIKGAKKADEGELKAALENFNKAVELNPLYAVALFNRATIKADLGDFRGAKEDFLKAKTIEANFDSQPNLGLRNVLRDEISNDYINFF